MELVIYGTKTQQDAFIAKEIPDDVTLYFLSIGEPVPLADAYFDLLFEEAEPRFSSVSDKPVFINAVLLDNSAGLPENFIRINAWPGFLERKTIEIAYKPGSLFITPAERVFDKLQWPFFRTPDIPGMIAARVIAMIINEAYFGLGDAISTKADIDTAMRLGTNYPYGPFEWSEKIGLSNIYQLLTRMAKTESRYSAAPALTREVQQLN